MDNTKNGDEGGQTGKKVADRSEQENAGNISASVSQEQGSNHNTLNFGVQTSHVRASGNKATNKGAQRIISNTNNRVGQNQRTLTTSGVPSHVSSSENKAADRAQGVMVGLFGKSQGVPNTCEKRAEESIGKTRKKQ